MESNASQEIDTIIAAQSGWKAEVLTGMRAAIVAADRGVVEDVKWKMPRLPEGRPLWTCNGQLCFVEIWKDNIKLLFPKGAHLKDEHKLFNARLDGADIRAIEYKETAADVDSEGLQSLVREAIAYNAGK